MRCEDRIDRAEREKEARLALEALPPDEKQIPMKDQLVIINRGGKTRKLRERILLNLSRV